jgi:hypothetical protein
LRCSYGFFLGLAACGGGRVGTWQSADLVAGAMVVRSDVGGRPARWLLDTGAQLSIFKTSFSDVEDRSVTIGDDSLELNLFASPDLDALLEGLEVSLGPLDGIVGWPALHDRGEAITLDYANSRMRLSSSGKHATEMDEDVDLGDPVVLEMSSLLVAPVIEATIQDVDAYMIADSGASAVLLDPELFAALADPPDTTTTTANTPDGLLTVDTGRLSTVEVGGEVLTDVDFVSYDSVQLDATNAAGTSVEGLVGASVLMRHVVTYDLGEGELTLQPYDEATQQRLVDSLHSPNAP